LLAISSNAMLTGAAFAAGEGLLQLIADGMPWFHFNAGFAVVKNVYAIQHAAYGGVYIISFFVVAINYLFTEFISLKQWKLLAVPAVIICLYVLTGFFLQQQFEKKAATANNFSLAVLSENILPDIKWDDKNGNMLVQKLLQLNKDAVVLKPDIALWSESVVPWTYQPDDDFINEILKTSSAENITHIIGINTEIKDNEVYNSAYSLLSNGSIAGRYDKQHLLALIEKPVGAIIFPFLSSEGFVAREKSMYAKPLRTKFGNAGMLICNESTLASAAGGMVQNGANFFCIICNDGWFNDTYIPTVHFYNARLRAVETRKDVAVNCNNGISGKIDADGNIAVSKSSSEPFVEKFLMQPNDVSTAAAEFPMLFVYLCAGGIALMIVIKLIRR
ncbi:MAG TPA: apolipoprotein N-acyltransferase, partial [Chitinophagaceae bacterium]|nr:apolipoprotein N-acyltransferase [Chitinophagaceae bacterium]